MKTRVPWALGAVSLFAMVMVSTLSASDALADSRPLEEVEPDENVERVWVPFNVAIWSPVELFFFWEDRVVAPLAVGVFWDEEDIVVGAQVSAIAQDLRSWLVGAQVAPVNLVRGWVAGVQIAPILNWHTKWAAIYGIQVGGGGNFFGQCFGICASWWNSHTAAGGILAAVFNTTHNRVVGLQAGLLNTIGLQVVSIEEDETNPDVDIITLASGDESVLHGLQVGGANMAGETSGAQLGGLNLAGELSGLQVGGVNIVLDQTAGVQLGAFNYADEVDGVQVGVINWCSELRGLQIGALNIATDNALPFMVVLNAGW